MRWMNDSLHQLRHFEDKNLQKYEYERIKDRMESTHTIKQSIKMIVRGIFFAVTLTAFEYGLKNPEILGFLRIVLRLGFFGSLIGVLQIPYGVYNLIKNLK